MSESRAANRNTDTTTTSEDPHHALRELGGRAHQIRAGFRAADHFFNAQGGQDASNTGSWLISSAVELAHEVAADIDSLARAIKERPSDAALQQRVSALRVRAHQLYAAAKAADHFLDLDSREDQETGSWLVATAMGLANKFSSELDDSATPARRPSIDKSTIEAHDPAMARRMAAATAPVRGAA